MCIRDRVKAYLHHDTIPWENVVISGWILDPDRKKMSKSKGNVITPIDTIEQYGADAVRYWAASARLGTDTTYDENVFLVGNNPRIVLGAPAWALFFAKLQTFPSA